MRKALTSVIALAVVAAGAGWFLTAPDHVDPEDFAGLTGDAGRGEAIFYAGGCAACHSAPGAEGEDKLLLVGGRAFETQFGTFYAPNISPDEEAGIGAWTELELADAMIKGTSPSGQHYYPAFPYSSYARARPEDVVDLHAYLQTLPAADTPSRDHDVGFPFNIRRALGAWKLLFFREDYQMEVVDSDSLARGRYLVEALGHCAECHTPRNALGGMDRSRWLGGAENPSGQGSIPNITSGALDWSEADIAEYLSSGFTPDFDVVGGEMADVVANTSQLTADDRLAIARYLKTVPAVE
ncbi:Fructose dehydrogenase cytochrome subunit precursor [Pseudooceanicola marinus]|uniref:Fructose dehydrogenase cytochrome subunit n=1 Tax=Pseudooceanicola marinus TaxID=396013 RepID=A0A1X6YLG8_9RHOB|nr:c-type cytochrome [Pseudooceanicola marinus]PJE29299.1 diacylglycerol kinase [Pseudooceanicola marinus]SLN24041.1 Fructose dehydrogenase cytochrome subunit precursor [Pseudooceanicola marinus]